MAETFAMSPPQARATDPEASAWVAANAGSGKTFVLAWRVIRLLLAGVAPARILCLTFTKAAAAEMASRIFGVLAQWATAPEARLAQDISALTGRPADAQTMARARSLFALALDSPGGLKIQTIHAFCEALLHQFPLEAGAAAGFVVLEEGQTVELADLARRGVYADIESGAAAGGLVAAFDRLLGEVSDETLAKALAEAFAWRKKHGATGEAQRALWQRFDLDPDETEEAFLTRLAADPPILDADLLTLARAADKHPGPSNDKFAQRARAALAAGRPSEKLSCWFALWLKADQELLEKAPITKAAANECAPIAQRFTDAGKRVDKIWRAVNDRRLLANTDALLALAEAVADRFDRLKRARNALEFDDLIDLTCELLERRDIGAWVRYKLDRGIDHLLVDEAQDTNPRQWRIIDALTGDFFAGEGAAHHRRTIFAVGDEKQSIFSFQGAAPEYFAAQETRFGNASRDARAAFVHEELHLSFRSTPDVLAAVDEVFAPREHHLGLNAEPRAPLHTAKRATDQGETWLWPMQGNPETPEKTDWIAPIDAPQPGDAAQTLARRIAATVAGWMARDEKLPGQERPIRPGDILVLVRKRDAFLTALIRRFAEMRLPTAGADRLLLTEHIAAEDLMAIGRAALLPSDDLALAGALKSPLFGVSEDELMRLAAGRGPRTLHDNLKRIAVGGSADAALAQAILARFEPLVAIAPKVRAHAFYARVLGEGGGRRAFLARLGNEVEDVLDAFEQAALVREEAGDRGLQDFLAFLDRSPPELKREADLARNEIRVMTAHGAKGLEAPIVFVVDPGAEPVAPGHLPRLLAVEGGQALWRTGSGRAGKDSGGLIGAALTRAMDAAEREYRRLLYVALTRAADRLIVCGYFRKKQPAGKTWHAMVEAQLGPKARRLEDAQGNVTLAWQSGDPQLRALAKEKPAKNGDDKASAKIARPVWLDRPAAAELSPPRPLSPSQAGLLLGRAAVGEIADAGNGAGDARDRGIALHRLLQYLPTFAVEARAEAGLSWLRRCHPRLVAEESESMVAHVLRVIADPRLEPLFGAHSRAEVEIAGTIAMGGGDLPVAGRIDRLAILPGEIRFADFKTGNPARADPAWRLQMALYGALLGQVYPGRDVRAFIVFTQTCDAIELPREVMAGELAALGESRHNAP
jgi:ATP-dependent helicase/nuclease subunit A